MSGSLRVIPAKRTRGGAPIAPSTSTRDDEDLDDIYDEDGFIYCAHGHEQCELCCTDHRVTNELERRGGFSEAVYHDVQEAFQARQQAEMWYVQQMHAARQGGSFCIGTRYAYSLRNEMLARFGDQLPPWPPARR